MLSYGHLVYDFGTVKNRGTEKKEPNRPGTESGTETGTVPSLARMRVTQPSLHLSAEYWVAIQLAKIFA